MSPLLKELTITPWGELLALREMETARQTCKRYGLSYQRSDPFILAVEGVDHYSKLGSGTSRGMYSLFQALVEDACFIRTPLSGFRRWHEISSVSGKVCGVALAFMDWHGIAPERGEKLICRAEDVKYLFEVGQGRSGGNLKRFIHLVWDAAERA